MMTAQTTPPEEALQRYFDCLVHNHDVLTTQYVSLIDADDIEQYSAEELALEVV